MTNKMKELNSNELKNVNGGSSSFAYRFGQFLRGIFMCTSAPGTAQFICECAINEQVANK
jgi:bacteriocin-like protein